MKLTRLRFTKSGFALVVTVLMMALLSVVVVATLSLSSISLRSVDKNSHRAIAQANARMALFMAIGQLQREAGHDQRVTASAEIKGHAANSHWTGVWKSAPSERGAEPVWLVSGSRPDPGKALSPKDSVVLATTRSAGKPLEIRAPFVRVRNEKSSGRFAYWIGDEGVKARIDLARPQDDGDTATEGEKIARSQSPLEPGLNVFDMDHQSTWAPFDPDQTALNKTLLVSMGTASLAANDSATLRRHDLSRHYFNDLTTGGFGLPVNVRDGGMKADLSLIFTRSLQNESFVSKFIGATPVAAKSLNADVLDFQVTDSEKFGLSKTITSGHSGGFVGPNWGNLFNYARLWEKVSGNELSLIGPHPLAETDLRQENWPPYREANKGLPNRQDIQHTNSGVGPVISVAQIGYYLGAEEAPASTGQKRYHAKLMVKPIIGLWNPYNVKIRSDQYMMEWAVAPYFRFDYQKPDANGTFPSNSGNRVEIWMRDYWLAKEGGAFPTDTAGQGGSYLRMITRPVDFQPGEHRLFSVEANPEMSDGYKNYLVPTLDPNGAYAVRIIRSEDGLKGPDGKVLPDQKKGQPLYIPSGYYGWFGDVFLQDTHWDGKVKTYGNGTRARFPKLDTKASSTWMNLKAVTEVTPDSVGNATHLSRYTNLWNGGRDETASTKPGFIPEPIRSLRTKINVSGAGGRTPHLIDSLAGGSLGHVGTWRFYTRNPTEVLDSSQGLRGWIDSNPRVIASNLRFDGSKNTADGIQGWHAASNLIAGRSDITFGDAAGGNRGLVSDGSWGRESRIPEGDPEPERWRGYGGPGSTLNSGGQTHVIVYDVPRTPLVSVGQFQHAELSRYNFEPGFVVGNSYANPRIPPGLTVQPAFGGMDFSVVDVSHEVNTRLWDTTFFSTLSPDHLGTGDSSFDQALKAFVTGRSPLPNPRMKYLPLPGDPVDATGAPSLDTLIRNAGDAAPEAMAAHIRISGAFNVNSTSRTAWKAVLSSMGASRLPVVDPASAQTSWSDPDGIRFNRFSHTLVEGGYDNGGDESAFWQGWRKLSEKDLDRLAEEIVIQVKQRGPFLSMADFVNRNPDSANREHQLKGALQAALDKVANSGLPETIGRPAENPAGSNFSGTITNENQAAGHASYLLQGDILQSLAPTLQNRADYFRIRTCGESLDADGKVAARAYCEAFVQRIPEYTDSRDVPETQTSRLRPANRTFGRKFQLVSFRWMRPDEI